MKQNYTSAGTSINSTKLPRVYNVVDFRAGSKVLDYGCGKYTDHIKAKMEEVGCEWRGYDKFNQSKDTNYNSLLWACTHRVDYVLCSNVLNVIDTDEALEEVINTVIDLTCGVAIFTIYEGNGTGVGKPSKNDCYQRNEKIAVYVDRIVKMGYADVKVQKGMIVVAK